MPSDIGRAGWAQNFRRVAGMAGHFGLAAIEDVFPMVKVDDLLLPENMHLGDYDLYFGSATRAATAAQFQGMLFGLRSTDIITLCCLEALLITSSQVVNIGWVNSGVATPVGRARDTRNNTGIALPTAFPHAGFLTASNAAQQVTAPDLVIPANCTTLIPMNTVLATFPVNGFQSSLFIENTVVNNAITVNGWWRERPAQVTERG